jgi:hypothetical protein
MRKIDGKVVEVAGLFEVESDTKLVNSVIERGIEVILA